MSDRVVSATRIPGTRFTRDRLVAHSGWAVVKLALLFFAVLPGLASAQAVGSPARVTGGEHGSFTRIVLQSSRPVAWSLSGGDRQFHLTLQPVVGRIDLDRAFDRIGRERLARITRDNRGLVLDLACDCMIEAFEDRPGVVVLDIRAVTDAADNGPVPRAPHADGPAPAVATALEMALRAGQTVADRLRGTPATVTPGQSDAADPQDRSPALQRLVEDMPPRRAPSRARPVAVETDHPSAARQDDADALARRMAARIAEATEQGLLTAAAGEPRGARLRPGISVDLPPVAEGQLRVLGTLSPETAVEVRGPPPRHCTQADALDFLVADDGAPFTARHAALLRALHGEFDRQNDGTTEEMIRLYLSHGFGAEARQMIDTARTRFHGHDLLLGLADLLEDRQSNSRLHLSRLVGCTGAAGLVAMLSATSVEAVAIDADQIALTFADLPDPLKRILGEPLTARLLEVGAVNQARIVMTGMRHAGPAGTSHPTMPPALIDAARGDREAAAARLAASPGAGDAQRLRLRLRLALETESVVAPALLREAEDAAAVSRREAHGVPLMSKVIRLHARDGHFAAGFSSIDRLRGWLGNSQEDRQLDDQLTDLMWMQLAQSADDHAFLAFFMTRGDRSAAVLADDTRTAIADRLLGLGLGRPALELVTPPVNAAQSLARATALLHLGEAAAALAALTGIADDTADAQAAQRQGARIAALRARALQGMGATEAAIVALAEDGRMREAMRLALMGGDWQLVERLLTRTAAGRAPGPASATAGPPSAAPDTGGGPAPGRTDPAPAAAAPDATRPEPELAYRAPPAPSTPAGLTGLTAWSGDEATADHHEAAALMALARAFGSAPGLAEPDAPATTAVAAPRMETAPPDSEAVHRNMALLGESATLRAMVEDLLESRNGQSPER